MYELSLLQIWILHFWFRLLSREHYTEATIQLIRNPGAGGFARAAAVLSLFQNSMPVAFHSRQ